MQFVVKLAVLLSCLPLPSAGEFHTLQYVYTATSGISDIPDFISVGILDGVEISYYDPSLKRNIPKQDWMGPLDQEYWNSETGISKNYEQIFKVDLDILGKRFNHTKVPPQVSLFQKDSSAVCHATGFYPEGVVITWKRDGEEMQEDVDVGETLPNMDGTFQKRAVLTVSPEEWKKNEYTCEVTHKSGEPIIKILIIEDGYPFGLIIACVVGALVVIGVIGFVMMKKKKTYYKADYKADASSDSDSHHTPRNRADC
ncbi:BOLA class I histocompatibility antigen, alpha chain BL3-7-like isoform X4 [Sardina pilchardus]|uniref:BOLA class I histocompatibility antigen, alpha chain BL3-7-like isoform X4 n=1 Tax=Sardina pilchardus TaxID=27697 RepID=UPI002E116AD9